MKRLTGRGIVILVMLGFAFQARGNGINDNGIGARSMALGGADVGWADDALGAMGVNPAALGTLSSSQVTLGGVGGSLDGHFQKSNISEGSLSQDFHALPEGAITVQIPKMPVTVGLSCVPEAVSLANWNYNDPPGGLGGVSYGNQQDKSEILELRSAIGVGWKVTPKLSLGGSVGVIYNENWLHAPYIFQNLSPASGLNGAKTLLNLHTSGVGWNGQVGLLYRITDDLQVGVSYESSAQVKSDGTAEGDPSLQFGKPLGTYPFHYDATVKNTFPQQVRAGLSWKFYPKWRLALQVDWIDWSDSFHDLPLNFSNGTNPTVSGALGAQFKESIPLNWHSEFVYRAGIEYNVTDYLVLRAGYCYGSDPVPSGTLTPLTAAILSQTISGGIGYHQGRYHVDLAYQYDLPTTANIATSGLYSGEYSNSSIRVSAQTVAMSVTVEY